MARSSQSEWTEASWNPIVGCTRASSGCTAWYAMRDAWRMAHNPNPKIATIDTPLVGLPADGRTEESSSPQPDWTGEVSYLPERLDWPQRWQEPRKIFVCSQSDLFHPQVDWHDTLAIFRVMLTEQRHTYQLLTKRPQVLVSRPLARHPDGSPVLLLEKILDLCEEMTGKRAWPEHIWMGVSIENRSVLWRTPFLRKVPAQVRFLSCEPLLGPLPSLTLDGIHWMLIDGESGPRARPMALAWVRDLIGRCREQHVAVFVKLMGTVWAKQHGERGKGGNPATWDADLRIREYTAPER